MPRSVNLPPPPPDIDAWFGDQALLLGELQENVDAEDTVAGRPGAVRSRMSRLPDAPAAVAVQRPQDVCEVVPHRALPLEHGSHPGLIRAPEKW